MANNQQTVIFFVRHGQTDSPYSNDPVVDDTRRLTHKGQQQSEANGRYLSEFAPAAIYSSPLARTMETAEIIHRSAEIPGQVIIGKDLFEIYDNDSFYSIGTRLPKFFQTLITEHSGEQIVCVSHQDVIETTLHSLGAVDDEMDFPCQMGDLYRLIFAGEKFVQATKLVPAKRT